MKNLLPLLFIATIIFATSCNKFTSPSYGTWSFKGTIFTASMHNVTTDPGGTVLQGLSGIPSTSGPQSQILVDFGATTLPAASGVYTVVSSGNLSPARVVAIQMTTPNGDYWSGDDLVTPKTITVTVSGSKVSISGAGIKMINANATDSSALSISGLVN